MGERRVEVSSKVVSILVLAATLTIWELLFKQPYYGWVAGQGGAIGFGEVFIGYTGIIFLGTIVTWIILRRLKQP